MEQLFEFVFNQKFNFESKNLKLNLFDSKSASGSMPLSVAGFKINSNSCNNKIDLNIINFYV